jgi:hypothetical protein
MTCKVCGGEVFKIRGFCLDRDGIREAEYCDVCGTIWKVTCSGTSKYRILKPVYDKPEREKLIAYCEYIISELKR